MTNNTERLNLRKEFNKHGLETEYELYIQHQYPGELYSACIRNKNGDMLAEGISECYKWIKEMVKKD